jgi:transcription-repair coupling factor (superfamily II helicase)
VYAFAYNNSMNLGQDNIVEKIVSQLEKVTGTHIIRAEGTWGSFSRLLTAYICDRIDRPIIYICSNIDDADKACDDLHTFGCKNIASLTAWEGAEDLADATDDIRTQRLRLVSDISQNLLGQGSNKFVITASVPALCQSIPNPKNLREGCLRLEAEKELSTETVIEWLVIHNFERVERVDLPGQFAVRGGIIDIYAPLTNQAVLIDINNKNQKDIDVFRVEFFGDTIESIRQINLDTQRSEHQLRSISVVSSAGVNANEQKELFLNILPKNTIIIFEEPAEIQETAKVFIARSEESADLYKWEDIYAAARNFTQLHISRFAPADMDESFRLDVKSVQQFQHKATSVWTGHKEALEELLKQALENKTVLLYCESSAEQQRIREIISDIRGEVPPRFHLLTGFVNQGFVINSLSTIVISHHELFDQFCLKQRRTPVRATTPVDSLSDLQEGDYVVHSNYGIGRYLGIEAIQEKTGINEYLTIEYADNHKIQVSIRNIALVQKYIGTSPARPKLSKIGSKKWLHQKEKVAQSVRDMAMELIDVQAKRKNAGGIAFGPDSNWQREFEQSFAYQQTPDQSTAAEQIKADMIRPVAMDRLLCGDVGYGKTELAMRAAFKAVENGKQVAVLTPTTVLSVQHGRTFTERFADFPVWVEVLNRFKTAAQARQIIAQTKEGKIDILIGTHRLLSKDIQFKDLGLLIIDEEQRFGVEHKEKLKRLRVNVDILTMTATPIPRTLHMAMLGLRDISSLATAPLDRRSIVTNVTAYNQQLITSAIKRELNRQGQVFFLHNRVKTIDKKAWEISKLIPDARIGVAHGQMSKKELESAMLDFVTGKTDVLVCSTIIESGLDIPNANTIFINDADRFGLAELHQLRGRVGRSKHRAWAYMLLPATRPITPLAAKRLKAIEEYSHLGAGFRIALRDLEIRGAGNILGPEQSGHIQAVGYQMYCQLLAEAVKEIKEGIGDRGQGIENNTLYPKLYILYSMIDLGFAVNIPRNYVPADRQRMDIYRRLAVASAEPDIEQIKAEMTDIYGPISEQVQMLLDLTVLQIKAGRKKIKSIVASGQDLIFSFDKDNIQSTEQLFANVAGLVRIHDPQTVAVRLAKNYFEPKTLIALLRKILGEKK